MSLGADGWGNAMSFRLFARDGKQGILLLTTALCCHACSRLHKNPGFVDGPSFCETIMHHLLVGIFYLHLLVKDQVACTIKDVSVSLQLKWYDSYLLNQEC